MFKYKFYPCLCLCFGFLHKQYKRPFRLTSLQALHIFLTDARTFTENSNIEYRNSKQYLINSNIETRNTKQYRMLKSRKSQAVSNLGLLISDFKVFSQSAPSSRPVPAPKILYPRSLPLYNSISFFRKDNTTLPVHYQAGHE